MTETLDEPRRRWGRKTGVRWVWGLCVDGRTVCRTRTTAHSASSARGLEVWRALGQRGRQTPVTITTDGAPSVLHAVDRLGPRSRRMRGWVHTRQQLHQQVPPQAWPAGKACGADRREAPTLAAGQRRQHASLAHSQATCPEAGRWLEAEASLHHLQVPARPRQDVRTSHLAERALAKERWRTKVMPHRWDEARVLKRVLAVLMRVRKRWGQKPLSECEQHHMRALRQPFHLDAPLVSMEERAKDRSPRRNAASAQ